MGSVCLLEDVGFRVGPWQCREDVRVSFCPILNVIFVLNMKSSGGRLSGERESRVLDAVLVGVLGWEAQSHLLG